MDHQLVTAACKYRVTNLASSGGKNVSLPDVKIGN
jgi:hypothetical protein